MIATDTNQVYLAPAEYVDSDHPLVRDTVEELASGARDRTEILRRIFYHVRDLHYGAPDFDRLESFKASTLLAEQTGYCVPKATAFVALARAAGFPARLGFADVTNHLATSRILDLMDSRLFAWHGYGEVLSANGWLKISPTFDARLCKKMNVAALEFDGMSDAHLQPFDSTGRTFMSYDKFHGTFHDVPARFLAAEMVRLYPGAHAAIRAGEFARQ